MSLYVLELQNVTNKDKKIFFDEEGHALYGKDEDGLIFAEGLEISSGYKIPPHIYVKDLENAFKLGMRVGIQKQENLSYKETRVRLAEREDF